MIQFISNYFKSVPAVFIDGVLYVAIAFFGAITAALSSDEASKYLSPEVLFWTRTFCSVNGAWILALKMFRSTGYAQHQEDKKRTGDTDFIKK